MNETYKIGYFAIKSHNVHKNNIRNNPKIKVKFYQFLIYENY